MLKFSKEQEKQIDNEERAIEKLRRKVKWMKENSRF